jgi:hypothetical protein
MECIYNIDGHYPSPRLLFKTQLYRFVRTSQETRYVSATKPNRLIPFREIDAVYCGTVHNT